MVIGMRFGPASPFGVVSQAAKILDVATADVERSRKSLRVTLTRLFDSTGCGAR